MTPPRLAAAFGLAATLAACGGSGPGFGPKSTGPLLGSGATYASAGTAETALAARVDEAFEAAGRFAFAELPETGSATYNGIASGDTTSGLAMSYRGNLALTVDFETGDVSGTLGNIVTTMGSPSTITPSTLSGTISSDLGDTAIAFASTPTGTGVIGYTGGFAQVIVSSGTGFIGGPQASVAQGTLAVSFDHFTGVHTGEDSFTAGVWHAE